MRITSYIFQKLAELVEKQAERAVDNAATAVKDYMLEEVPRATGNLAKNIAVKTTEEVVRIGEEVIEVVKANVGVDEEKVPYVD